MSEEASPRFGPNDEMIDDRENEGCPMEVFILDGGLRIGFVQRFEKRLLQSRDDQRRFFVIA